VNLQIVDNFYSKMNSTTAGFPNGTSSGSSYSQAFDAVNVINIILIYIIMIGVGASLDLERAWLIIKQKKALIVATLNHAVIMPLLLWGFARADPNLPMILRAAMVVVGTCPGGVLSNVICMWLHADPHMSITITNWTVILSLGTLPLNLYLYLTVAGLGAPPAVPSGRAESVHPYAFHADWVGLGVSCAAVILGNLTGTFLKSKIKRKRIVKRIELCCLLFGVPQAILALVENSQSNAPVWRMHYSVYVLLLAATLTGLLWATLSAHYLFRFEKPSATAIAIEASVQNTNIALGILSISITDPQLRAQSLGVPLAYATISLVQSILFGILLWKAGWTTLDPWGRDPCSIWCSEYQQQMFDKDVESAVKRSSSHHSSGANPAFVDEKKVLPVVQQQQGGGGGEQPEIVVDRVPIIKSPSRSVSGESDDTSVKEHEVVDVEKGDDLKV